MKRMNLSKIGAFVLFLASSVIFSSCNRGYGCPNNFSVNDNVLEVVTTVINYLH